eukprot:Nk52_evm42s621 gene=Nk52_evmTU42s621
MFGGSSKGSPVGWERGGVITGEEGSSYNSSENSSPATNRDRGGRRAGVYNNNRKSGSSGGGMRKFDMRIRSGSVNTYLNQTKSVVIPRAPSKLEKGKAEHESTGSLKPLSDSERTLSGELKSGSSGELAIGKGKLSGEPEKGVLTMAKRKMGMFTRSSSHSDLSAKAISKGQVRKESLLRTVHTGSLSSLKGSSRKNLLKSISVSEKETVYRHGSRESSDSGSSILRSSFAGHFHRSTSTEHQKVLAKVGVGTDTSPTYRLRNGPRFSKPEIHAGKIIHNFFLNTARRSFLRRLSKSLPSLSPIARDWPACPLFLFIPSSILKGLYHSHRCRIYRSTFSEAEKLAMDEKLVASELFRDRKLLYDDSVGKRFVCDRISLKYNIVGDDLFPSIWSTLKKKYASERIISASIVRKYHRNSMRECLRVLLISDSYMFVLESITFELRSVVRLSEIVAVSVSPFGDDTFIIHVDEHKVDLKVRKKGDFIFSSRHVVEVVSKMVMAIENVTKTAVDLRVSEWVEIKHNGKCALLAFIEAMDSRTFLRYVKVGKHYQVVVPKYIPSASRTSHDEDPKKCSKCQESSLRVLSTKEKFEKTEATSYQEGDPGSSNSIQVDLGSD